MIKIEYLYMWIFKLFNIQEILNGFSVQGTKSDSKECFNQTLEL